jgi:hypothetical protein
VVYFADEYGIRLDTWSDNMMSNVDIGQSGDHGLYVNGTTQTRFTNIKVWLSGRISGTSSGIYVRGGNTNMFSNIGTQENYGNGMWVGPSGAGTRCSGLIVSGLQSDSDNLAGDEYYGLLLNGCDESMFNVIATSKLKNSYPTGTQAQPYAAVGLFNAEKNYIVSNSKPLQDGGGVTWLVQGSAFKDNFVDLCRNVRDQTPSTATVPIQPTQYRQERVTLTGNRTINAPSRVATGANAPVGLRFSIMLIQDGTGGRAVTFNAAYKIPTWVVVDTAANARTVIEFECQADGDWLMVGSSSQSGNRATQSVTSSATLASDRDYVVLIGSGGAPTLPTAVGNTRLYLIKNVHSATRTISTTSAQTIEGLTTYTLQPGESITLVSDNSNWRII